MAIDKKTAVQDVPYDELKITLERRKQILNF
jgi:hypothetical protein